MVRLSAAPAAGGKPLTAASAKGCEAIKTSGVLSSIIRICAGVATVSVTNAFR
jgi:hypothetical protein